MALPIPTTIEEIAYYFRLIFSPSGRPPNPPHPVVIGTTRPPIDSMLRREPPLVISISPIEGATPFPPITNVEMMEFHNLSEFRSHTEQQSARFRELTIRLARAAELERSMIDGRSPIAGEPARGMQSSQGIPITRYVPYLTAAEIEANASRAINGPLGPQMLDALQRGDGQACIRIIQLTAFLEKLVRGLTRATVAGTIYSQLISQLNNPRQGLNGPLPPLPAQGFQLPTLNQLNPFNFGQQQSNGTLVPTTINGVTTYRHPDFVEPRQVTPAQMEVILNGFNNRQSAVGSANANIQQFLTPQQIATENTQAASVNTVSNSFSIGVSSMASMYIPKLYQPKVYKTGVGAFTVNLDGLVLATFATKSQARIFSKRLEALHRYLVNATSFSINTYTSTLNNFLTMASGSVGQSLGFIPSLNGM